MRGAPGQARGDESGFSSLVVTGLTGLVVLAGIAVALVGGVLDAVHRASAAADLAALAGAQARQQWQDPCTEAAVIAAEHAGRVERCTVDGEHVTVRVSCEVPALFGIDVVDAVSRAARAGPETGPAAASVMRRSPTPGPPEPQR